jgi:hypothetical protein|eukprot:COSAG02_NODE_1316_length_13310_cov_22.515101_4_plen_80_part_00
MDEDEYTTELDMSKLTPEQIRRAEALAREIETGRQTHNEFGEFRDDVCDDEYSDDGYRLRVDVFRLASGLFAIGILLLL